MRDRLTTVLQLASGDPVEELQPLGPHDCRSRRPPQIPPPEPRQAPGGARVLPHAADRWSPRSAPRAPARALRSDRPAPGRAAKPAGAARGASRADRGCRCDGISVRGSGATAGSGERGARTQPRARGRLTALRAGARRRPGRARVQRAPRSTEQSRAPILFRWPGDADRSGHAITVARPPRGSRIPTFEEG